MPRIAPCLILMLGLPAAAGAQSRTEPNLLVTIFGGVTSGSSLWVVDKQPLSLLDEPSVYDTLRLTRTLEPGISLGASATYFSSPHFGITAEIFFMGFGLDDGCEFVYTAPGSDEYNPQICADIAEHGGSASTIAFTLGGIYRFAPRGFAAPYLRLQGGVTARNTSTVEMVGRFVDVDGNTQTRLVVPDPGHSTLKPTFAAGVGVLVPIGPGYQVGLELRDNLLLIQTVTGPASYAATPTETALEHGISLVARFDIVLERKRGRRY
jgi:hypothetical protein